MELIEFVLKNYCEKILDEEMDIPKDLDKFTYFKHEGYQYKMDNSKLENEYHKQLIKCKCGCGKDISNKHPNARFYNAKHKDRFYNLKSDRI